MILYIVDKEYMFYLGGQDMAEQGRITAKQQESL